MAEKQIEINNLSKVYDNGFKALKNINLQINKGEIFAMLGPNGAGKTSLISIICGIVKPSSGNVTVENFDIIKNYRDTRSRIGLVPQELTLEQFETVFNNVSYSRGLYGKKPNPLHIEKVLRQLSLWDKKDFKLRQLSGGMKRRVLIAKALSHEPSILFLDEPTAGVDLFCCAFVLTVFFSFYNKLNEKTAYISIIIGLIAGILMFPFPDFSKSLLVGVFISKELFSPFVSQSLLFLSFVIATFLPAIILKLKKN